MMETMRWGHGSAAQWSREAAAVWQRTLAHAADSLGHSVHTSSHTAERPLRLAR